MISTLFIFGKLANLEWFRDHSMWWILACWALDAFDNWSRNSSIASAVVERLKNDNK